jgi:hypothetical protein
MLSNYKQLGMFSRCSSRKHVSNKKTYNWTKYYSKEKFELKRNILKITWNPVDPVEDPWSGVNPITSTDQTDSKAGRAIRPSKDRPPFLQHNSRSNQISISWKKIETFYNFKIWLNFSLEMVFVPLKIHERMEWLRSIRLQTGLMAMEL